MSKKSNMAAAGHTIFLPYYRNSFFYIITFETVVLKQKYSLVCDFVISFIFSVAYLNVI